MQVMEFKPNGVIADVVDRCVINVRPDTTRRPL